MDDRYESLFARAAELPAGEARAAFLAEACRGRERLKDSLEKLLAAHDAAGRERFLESREAGDGDREDGGVTGGTGGEAATRAAGFLRDLRDGKVPDATVVLAGLVGRERVEVLERIGAVTRVRALTAAAGAAAAAGVAGVRGGEGQEAWPRIPGYRLEGRLGAGGLGVVYAAHDEKLNRRVAVKVLRAGTGEGVRRRLLDEARKAAALEDSSVVTIYSVLDEADPPAIVMEWVEGFPLDRAAAPLTFQQKAGLLRDVARGLAAAHARGVIHRDLKPQNVVVGPELRPRLLDFGLALSLEEAAAIGRGFEGTPLYASPEQVSGRPLGPATDVFSFGSLMFEVLTGRPPFGGETVGEVLEAIATCAPPFLRDVAVGVPEDLQAIALACLAWDPGARPTAADLVVELGRYLAGEPVRLRPRLYEDLLRQRVTEHAREVANWEAQGIVSREEGDRLQVMHRRLLADEDHWIIDARRLTSVQTGLYTATWMVVVASVLWVWKARDIGEGVWGWLTPLVASVWLLGAGWWAERRRETLAAASFLASGALSLAPALLALLKAWGWLAEPPDGVTQFLGTDFTNAQGFVACCGALGVSVWALARLRMTGFAWTSAVLGIGAYLFGWMTRGWLDWALWRQGLACLPLAGLVVVALGFERMGRVRWSFPFHLAALVALVGSLGVMAYDGPTLAKLGVPEGGYFDADRLVAFSMAGNGLVFLGLMMVVERAASLDLRRASKLLEMLALVHAEGALFLNAQNNREHAQVGWDVGLYLATALLFLVLGAWRARWRMLVGALAGLALGSYLLVDLGLVPKVPFILALGLGGGVVALAVFNRLLRLGRAGPGPGRKD